MNRMILVVLLGALGYFGYTGGLDEAQCGLLDSEAACERIADRDKQAAKDARKARKLAKTAEEAAADQYLDRDYELKRIIIGLDLSASNPLVDDRNYAKKVARRLQGEIENMRFESELSIRTFGVYDAGENPFSFDATVGRDNRPEALARDTYDLISQVPDLVDQGVFESQNMTNILGFLDSVSFMIECKSDYRTKPTTIILVTDGVEDSEFVRLAKKGSHLPAPEDKLFYRCYELQVLGVGRGVGSPRETRRLRDEWEDWAKAAGFKKYTGLNDW